MQDSLIKIYAELISENRKWLGAFEKERSERWENLLAQNPEAAICEAATRRFLNDQNISVEPYEDLSTGGPDYLCIRNEQCFYVETTCVTKKVATKESGLTDMPQHKACCYGLLTKKIFAEVCNKTPQCSNLGAPCLITICTLHFQAGCLCFDKHAAEDLLTGTSFITAPIDTRTGEMMREPYEATDLESAVFIRPIKVSAEQTEFARSPISALLLCPFGTSPSKIIGVLHPNPNHMFDRNLLPAIEFGRLSEGYEAGQFKVKWV